MKHLRVRLLEINNELSNVRQRMDLLIEEREAIYSEISLLEHPCECVNLNSKMGIHDMIEQELRGRVGLGLGLVANTLSALRSCSKCGGTGKPRP